MVTTQLRPTLYYVHDPMCSWCWGFRTVLEKLLCVIPPAVQVVRLLGGLAPDSDQPMAEPMKKQLRQTWLHIESMIPEVRFNHAFWETCQPRRSTYPGCRAVIAARFQGIQFDEMMTHAIQRAYYLESRNPSDVETLLDLADCLGLNQDRFRHDLVSMVTQQTLLGEISLVHRLGVQGFPTLAAQTQEGVSLIPVDYNDVGQMLSALRRVFPSVMDSIGSGMT